MTDSNDLQPPPAPLPQTIRLLLALSALCATQHPPVQWSSAWYRSASTTWLHAVCKLLSIDTAQLPPGIDEAAVQTTSEDQREEWTDDERRRMAGVLVEGSLANEAGKSKEKKEEALRYTPIARALSHRTLELLGLPAKELLPDAEKNLSATLFKALQASQAEAETKVESTRAAHSQGWGGALGRHLATGAGVIAGGVLIGVTGGLAAPAIAAVLAPLGIGSILTAGAAPVVLGTLFGVGGGGLAGRRVRERWRGVEEFSFIEVGSGTKATKEEVEELRAARERYKAREKKGGDGEGNGSAKDTAEVEKSGEAETDQAIKEDKEPIDPSETADEVGKVKLEESGEDDQNEADDEELVEHDRAKLEEKLLNLSIQTGTRTSVSSDTGSPRTSLDSPRPSLHQGKDEKALADAKKPPSLTATIVVPGLMTVSRTEAITAWRGLCSDNVPLSNGVTTLNYEARKADRNSPHGAENRANGTAGGDKDLKGGPGSPGGLGGLGLKDGRDVYLLHFESATMLKTGRDIDHWVGTKLKGKIKGQIIKRTVLNAYFAAVSLPMSVYSMAGLALDNTWMQAQDRAAKAGRILGEVLEKRVQGERPVVLIGSSLGALTILKALLYLASLTPPEGATSAVPAYVESAYFISLPSAPTPDEWAKVRSVVSRRVVNAWSDADLVLAGVVRLHEVVSRATTLSNGIRVAGLGQVNQPGVQDVDVSSVLRGHMELQTKMGEVLRVIDIDA